MPPLEEINLTKEVPKGSKNRKTIAREWLAFLQEETNLISRQIETLSMEDIIHYQLYLKPKKAM